MAQLLVFVLDNLEQCPAILDAWEEAGVTGVTILESRSRGQFPHAVQDDLPLLPTLRHFLAGQELRHRTLFTVVADHVTLERVLVATQQVIGDFADRPPGLLFVVPVTIVLDLERRGPE